jgi:hypothetical protein
MSVVRDRRAREFAGLQAAGWTVRTITPWERLRPARREDPVRAAPRASAAVVVRRRGWAR